MAAGDVASALSEAERYRLLIEAIADYAIFMLDPEGRVASWNPGARRFKGYTAEEVIGQHFSRFYTEADRAAGLPERALERASTEGRFENQGWRVRKDGTRFWAHVVIDAIRSPEGKLLGFAKITRDLSEKRAQEEALQRSEQQFRILVQGVTDYALYMLDPEGLVSSWNSGAERIKGYGPDEVIGQHFSLFYTAEDREAGLPARALEAASRDGRYESEGWRQRKDGTRIWVNAVLDALRSPEGQLIGFAKITRDITEKRAAEQSLEQAREQLLQAQKMEAIGLLTGGIAHDFNNLLSAILSSLELARKYLPDDPRVLRLLDNAEQGAQRGATLTQRLLAYARRQPLEVQPVEIPSLIEGLRSLITPSLGPGMSLVTQFEGEELIALTDPGQLETALLNLCINSRDAMPGGGRIEIGARRIQVGQGKPGDLKQGDYLCLSVTDEGDGMDQSTLARAAEPFFTTKGIGKGTGLGLPMVHGLAAQSGGRLVLKSTPGTGTTAELWLPAARLGAGHHQALRGQAGNHVARRLRILVVDDDELVLTNTAMMLEDLGHAVRPVSGGQQALSIIETDPAFDLVLTDHAMPGMTGIQLAGQLSAKGLSIPVLLVTGYAEPDMAEFKPRLSKPFTQPELAAAVADLVG